jgi:hypothetical protein
MCPGEVDLIPLKINRFANSQSMPSRDEDQSSGYQIASVI